MAQAVAPCPEVTLKTKGSTFKGLLDFGSMVTLINESFFQSNLAKSITPMTGDKVNAHQLFNLKGVEDGQVPLSKYFEMDVEIRGFKIPQVGFLVKRNNAPLVDSKGKKTKLPAIAGCNLIRLGMEEFIRVHGFDPLDLFECPTGFDPLLFSTFCVYYYTKREREKEKDSTGWEMPMATQPKKPKKVHQCLKKEADQKMRVIWRDMQGWLQLVKNTNPSAFQPIQVVM